jgi:predicted Fe-Mo cluster-binding NifX family protein
MKVKEVTYERLSNQRVGRFENERAACTVTINTDDDPRDAMKLAQFYVEEQLGLLPTEEDVQGAIELLKAAGIKVVSA